MLVDMKQTIRTETLKLSKKLLPERHRTFANRGALRRATENRTACSLEVGPSLPLLLHQSLVSCCREGDTEIPRGPGLCLRLGTRLWQ